MTAPIRAPSTPGSTVPDAPPGNWVDRLAPAGWQPYLRLARFDRPIGAWLLLFPAWWAQALAEVSLGRAYPNPLVSGAVPHRRLRHARRRLHL